MAQCAKACGLTSKPRVSTAQYEFWHQNREAAYNVRACFSVKSNWGACRLLFHHMLRIFSYLFMSCLSLKGKSFIPPLVSVAQRHCFHLRNWKIIKSSFCLLCVCCKAPASPYAFQFHTRAWRRQQDNDKVSDIWKNRMAVRSWKAWKTLLSIDRPNCVLMP